MSNIIPPLLSNTPPPIIGSLDDDEDDEFGHFTSAYNEVLSVPSSPLHSPLDINSNTDASINRVFGYVTDSYFIDKDYQDKRKQCDTSLPALSEIKVNLSRTVNSHTNSEESVPREEEAEDDTSVPDPVECKTIVPSIQNVDKSETVNVESEPPSKDEQSTTREKDQLVLIEEPPELTLDDYDEDQFDDFSCYTESACKSDSHSLDLINKEKCNVEESKDSNSDKVELSGAVLSAHPDSDVISNVNNVVSNESENSTLYLCTDGDTELQEVTSASTNVSHSSIMKVEGNPKDDVISELKELSAFELAEVPSLPDESATLEHEQASDFAEFQASSIADEVSVRQGPSLPYTSDFEHEQPSHFEEFQASNTAADVSMRQEESQFADFASFQEAPEDDEFDTFCDFHDALPQLCQDEEDDFGDFGDYTQNQITPMNVPMGTHDVLRNAEKIITDMFPVFEASCPSPPEQAEFIQNLVFQQIKDITETNALTYQWIKSSCQDNLLKALNIDTRNILYGPGWNPSMPKFAANLSFAPLEPVKSDVLMPTSPSQTSRESPTLSSVQSDIPSAQFDWTGSGLTNPLDYMQANTMLLDLEQLVASLDLTSTSSLTSYAPSPSDDFDEWEFWLKSLQKDSKENFSPKNSSTHRNYDLPQTPTNIFELPRSQDDNDSVNSLHLVTDTEIETKQDVSKTEDDFGDFASYQFPKREDEPGWLKPTLLTPDLPRKTQEKDEFTDFQTSLPLSKETSGIAFASSILEPLKPMVLKQSQTSTEPPQINWPAPGITDDDIKNIELNYSIESLPKKQKENVPSGNRKPKPELTSIDEDDWSDFVCHPVSAPMGKTHFTVLHHQSERSSTPELQLSVPQLTHLQPPKAPIPVITPNGLIQTKIPSNVPCLKNTSSFQPSYPPIQANAHFQPSPSIISNQYQNHMNGPVFSRMTKNGFRPGHGDDDDDDWTDFISSPPVQNIKLQNGVDWSRGALTPNIITNPVHFESYRSYAAPQSAKRASKQVTIPSISALPDLDFIGPKSRAFTKK